MDKIEELLKKNMLKGKRLLERSANCPNEGILAAYLNNSLKADEKNKVEAHLSDCLYCLEQLSLAQKAQKAFVKGDLPPSEDRVIEKAKKVASLAPNNPKNKGTVWLLATIVA